MAKEVLRISDKKVVVDYDFRNDTDQDVTTEGAFPVPPYENYWQQQSLTEESFSDFRLRINGKPVTFQAEAKATLKGKDVTAILATDKIDVASFGHFEELPDGGILIHDLTQLPKTEQNRLVALGLFDTDQQSASWTVHLQYHWTQTFPAHSTVHIRHEYSPAVGFTQIDPPDVEDFLAQFNTGHGKGDDPDDVKLLSGFCVNQPFLRTLARQLRESASQAKTEDERLVAGVAYPQWVDFILTSANTWQRPIEDFTLIIERPQPEQDRKTLISFCSPANGKVEKLDADHFQVHLTNFIPTAELHIGFFEVPLVKPAQPAVKK